MSHQRTCALAAALVLSTGACSEFTGPTDDDPALSSAFSSVLLGFDNVQSSFSGGPGGGLIAWGPGGEGHGGPRPGGDRMRGSGPGGERMHGGGPRDNGLAGGGLGGLFLGGGFGAGFGHGRHGDPILGDSCAFDASTGRVLCEPVERNGLTIVRSAAFTDASGAVQSAFDSITTNTINVRVSVSGTTERRNGATSTVEHASDRTVSGLAAGSTQRTLNGTSAGTESTQGTSDRGDFTAVRVMGDTIDNVVIPMQTGTPPYPTSGTVIRSMQVTLTLEGEAPVTSTRREVITYNGSTTAQITITRDGVTRTCTLPLPHGRPVCE